MFVREADEAVRICSAGRDAYLDYDVLERALRDKGAHRRRLTPTPIAGGPRAVT